MTMPIIFNSSVSQVSRLPIRLEYLWNFLRQRRWLINISGRNSPTTTRARTVERIDAASFSWERISRYVPEFPSFSASSARRNVSPRARRDETAPFLRRCIRERPASFRGILIRRMASAQVGRSHLRPTKGHMTHRLGAGMTHWPATCVLHTCA